MKIAVIGTGYVGLVTGTCLADAGHTVTCVDIDETKVAKMQAGQVPIYEPGLEDLFKKNIASMRLYFNTDLAAGVKDAEIIFLALPTPPGEDGSADLSYIVGVADQLGGILKQYTVIVNKSTVPVGTAETVAEHIAKTATVAFDVVSNPEFLREGHAIQDFKHPDRIVIGTESKKAKSYMQEVYKDFTDTPEQMLFMDERSSELTKYAANAFLATKITFMNQIANLCEIVGADVDSIRRGIGSDDRIGSKFLNAGIGYGGSCFPKDVMALNHTSDQYGYDFSLLKTVSSVNHEQKQRLGQKVFNYYENQIYGKQIALWGLAFKPDTDDIREAPAIEIINFLTERGAHVVAYDPQATANVKKIYADNEQLTFADDMYQAVQDVDALVVATEWQDFKDADTNRVKSLMRAPVIFDGRNIYNPAKMQSLGFHYESMGRSTIFKEGI